VGASLAFLICVAGVAGLFFLDRDASVRTAPALWLPVVWVWIAGSRPVSVWFGLGGGNEGGLSSTLDGSPADAAVFAALMLVGIVVLFGRQRKTAALLKVNGPIIVYFLYCLASVAWSPIPGPAFKRWTKAVGELVMVLIVLTDGRPIEAIRRLFSRIGFILFPLSVTLIRYTDLGRGYDPDGIPMNTGVATTKNELGLTVFVISLGALWNVRSLLVHKDESHRSRRLVAQFAFLAFGLALLGMAHSATSVACFILGGGLILVTGLPAFRNRPGRVGILCLVVILAGGLMMLSGGASEYSSALGRGHGLSGRTDIWAAVIGAAGNPIIGTGFESFWNANVQKVNRSLHLAGFLDMSNLVSAHNGYLEVYVDLGLIGVCLVALILISGYRHSVKAFQYNPEVASLMLAYVTTGTFYSIAEAGFRTMTPSWIFLLLAVVSANGMAARAFGSEVPSISATRGSKSVVIPALSNLRPAGQPRVASRIGRGRF
jgi:exopolysaccharide production protein ExoQ